MPDPNQQQPAAVMLSVANNFAGDARLRAAACESDLMSLASMTQTMSSLSVILRASGQGMGADVVEQLLKGLQGLGVSLESHRTSFAGHAEAWDREAGVWRQVLEQKPTGGGT